MLFGILKELKKALTEPLPDDEYNLEEPEDYGNIKKRKDNVGKKLFRSLTNEEIEDLYKEQEINSRYANEIEEALKNEKNDLNASISVYEKFVKKGYINTSIPYDRLAINYRKLGLYEKEIFICKMVIERFSNKNMDPIVERFKIRLEKAELVKEKRGK